jgi:putative ABC transport system permease protein
MAILTRLAVRNLLRHPWRTTATVLGVALGIAAVLATLSVGANVRANLQADLDAAAGPADLLIAPGAGGRAVMDAQPLREAVAGTPGVDAFLPVLNVRVEPLREIDGASRPTIPGVDTGFQLSGRDVSRPERLPARLSAGRWPAPGEPTIALSDAFAEVRGLGVGDEVTFATRFGEWPLEVVGLMDAGLGYASSNGGRVAIAPLATVQEGMRLAGRVSHLEVVLAEGARTPDVEAALATRLNDRYTVAFPAGSGEVAGGIVQTLQAGLLVLAVTLLALGGFMAYNTFMAGVVERTREYALLRTVALTRRNVRRLALTEASVVAAIGAVAGVLLGVAMAWLLTRINAFVIGFEVRTLVVPVWAVAAGTGVGAAVALGASLLPARSASALSPLAARREAEQARAPSRAGLGWALLALAVALTRLPWSGPWALVGAGLAMATFAVGTALAARSLLRPAFRLALPVLRATLGVAGRLGAAFADRSTSRNGVAVGTVVVGTGLIVGVGAMVAGINRSIADWVDTTIVGDLFVTSPVSFPADFEARAGEVAGVDQVSGVGIRVVRFQPEDQPRGRSVALILVDASRFDPEEGFGTFQYVQGQGDDRAGYEALRDPDGVLVASTLRERFGVGVGDTISLRTDDGFAPFDVGAVVVDFTGGGETVVASIDQMDRFGGGTPDLYVLTVEANADVEAVRERLVAAFPELYLDATPNADYRAELIEISGRTFATTNTLLLLAVLIAALGVANTLGMNLATRSRELATLRTLGLSRGGVRRVVIAEGLVVVVLGSVLGVAFGLLLADVVTAGAAALTGYRIEPVLPWGLVGLALVASPLVGLVASLLPARRAARLAPVAALRGAE